MAETPEERDRIEMNVLDKLLQLIPLCDGEPLSAGGTDADPDAILTFPQNSEGRYEWKLTWKRTGFDDRPQQKSDRALGRLDEAKQDAQASLSERGVTLLTKQPASQM